MPLTRLQLPKRPPAIPAALSEDRDLQLLALRDAADFNKNYGDVDHTLARLRPLVEIQKALLETILSANPSASGRCFRPYAMDMKKVHLLTMDLRDIASARNLYNEVVADTDDPLYFLERAEVYIFEKNLEKAKKNILLAKQLYKATREDVYQQIIKLQYLMDREIYNNNNACNATLYRHIAACYEISFILGESSDDKESMQKANALAVALSSSDETLYEKRIKYVQDFNLKTAQIQANFKTQLDQLKDYADVYNALNTSQMIFFDKLSWNNSEADLQKALTDFRERCHAHVAKADKIVGHGWLFRIVEALCKAVAALFVGLFMAVGSIFKQGFVNPSHRQWYKDSFFSWHQTKGSKDLQAFKTHVFEEGENTVDYERLPAVPV